MKRTFAAIATRYDNMNRVMSLALDRRWRRAALAAAALPAKGTVLDLACGTGEFTVEIRRRFPEAQVIGVDLTPEMLAVARTKLGGADGIRLQEGDAQNLSSFKDGAFGMVVCGFGFRNFPNRAKVLAECRRVLVPGGELVVLELFRPLSRPLGALVGIWLATVALILARGARTEYAYLRRSVEGMISAEEFSELAGRCGFTLLRRRFLFPAATALILARNHS